MTSRLTQETDGYFVPRTEPARPGSVSARDRSTILTRLHPEFGQFLSAHTVASVLDRHVSGSSMPEEAEERTRRELAEILSAT